LRSNNVVHGTAPLHHVSGRRIGTACVLSKSVLTAAKNSVLKGTGSYWNGEELLAMLNTCTINLFNALHTLQYLILLFCLLAGGVSSTYQGVAQSWDSDC
jgi:hypothetical protein